MGKARRHEKTQKKQTPNHQPSKPKGQGIRRRQHSQNGSLSKSTNIKPPTSGQRQNQKSRPQRKVKVPFTRYDRVLLIGEGDFSFALSLAKNYVVGAIVATSYDDAGTLRTKYPQIESTLQVLEGSSSQQAGHECNKGISAAANEELEEWKGFSSSSDKLSQSESDPHARPFFSPLSSKNVTVLHGINGTTLSKNPHKKLLNPHSPFTKIVFNFPHTGGLSTDVNRQVRANQELLVNFFNAAKPLLATRAKPAEPITVNVTGLQNHNEEAFDSDLEDDDDNTDNEDVLEVLRNKKNTTLLHTGQILVTLFEGEPYTLWNIRDLARHCGLQMVESFKFDWSAYPEYKHARTIGEITTGKDRSDEGKRKGAWRGEERDARCYVLGLKEEVAAAASVNGGGRKRKARDESDDSD